MTYGSAKFAKRLCYVYVLVLKLYSAGGWLDLHTIGSRVLRTATVNHDGFVNPFFYFVLSVFVILAVVFGGCSGASTASGSDLDE